MRLNAYYYSFDSTGEELVDRVLSAVACAGKAYHLTESWNEPCGAYEPFLLGECPIDWIQNAAIDAAAEIERLRDALSEASGYLESCGYGNLANQDDEAIERYRILAGGDPVDPLTEDEQSDIFVRMSDIFVRMSDASPV